MKNQTLQEIEMIFKTLKVYFGWEKKDMVRSLDPAVLLACKNQTEKSKHNINKRTDKAVKIFTRETKKSIDSPLCQAKQTGHQWSSRKCTDFERTVGKKNCLSEVFTI